MTKKPRARKNYVNKADLLVALGIHAAACKEAKENGKQRPDIPRYIGECIWDIANGVAKRPNFASYPFREDMVMDGVENCLQYMHNFNPEKTDNPFGYFTQIVWYAFLRRIAKEKKQMYIRYKSSDQLLMMGQTYEGGDEITMHLGGQVDYINDFIDDYETKMANAKKPKDKSVEILENGEQPST